GPQFGGGKAPTESVSSLWLVSHNRLLTNSERRRRHISATVACERCKREAEDTLHVLRDCRFADQVWRKIIPPERYRSFFSGSLNDWLLQELNS
ncbi:Putative ribonuclease H protein At1g65750, partial [Linum perenne]